MKLGRNFQFFLSYFGQCNVTTSEISWPLVILNFLNILSLQSLISKCFLITRTFFLTVSQETFGNKIPLLLSKTRKVVLQVKKKRFKKIAWIQSHHLYLQWKYKLLVGKFPWDIAGRCQQTFENKKFVDITQQCFALLPKVKFLAHDFHSRWGWWDWIQAISLNLF